MAGSQGSIYIQSRKGGVWGESEHFCVDQDSQSTGLGMAGWKRERGVCGSDGADAMSYIVVDSLGLTGAGPVSRAWWRDEVDEDESSETMD